MKHARTDYQVRWPEDPALEKPELLGTGCTPIAPGEPVLLLRAADKHFFRMLLVYRDLLFMDASVPEETRGVADAILLQHLERASDWQAQHGKQTPDLALAVDGQETPLGTGRSLMEIMFRNFDRVPAAPPMPDLPQE